MQRVGWAGAEEISGAAHTYFYAQSTADGRVAIGGRGKPYLYGSGFDHHGGVDPGTVRAWKMFCNNCFLKLNCGLPAPGVECWVPPATDSRSSTTPTQASSASAAMPDRD